MQGAQHDLQRMREARRRLARARQRVRRLSWLAREPESLDTEVPLLNRTAFLRALARFQAIRLRREQAALLILRLDPMPASLRRAVAMHLLERTRNCDTLGCADSQTFLLLLKGADDAGAQAAAQRLHVELRTLAADMGVLTRARTQALDLSPRMNATQVMELLGQTGSSSQTIATQADAAMQTDGMIIH